MICTIMLSLAFPLSCPSIWSYEGSTTMIPWTTLALFRVSVIGQLVGSPVYASRSGIRKQLWSGSHSRMNLIHNDVTMFSANILHFFLNLEWQTDNLYLFRTSCRKVLLFKICWRCSVFVGIWGCGATFLFIRLYLTTLWQSYCEVLLCTGKLACHLWR